MKSVADRICELMDDQSSLIMFGDLANLGATKSRLDDIAERLERFRQMAPLSYSAALQRRWP